MVFFLIIDNSESTELLWSCLGNGFPTTVVLIMIKWINLFFLENLFHYINFSLFLKFSCILSHRFILGSFRMDLADHKFQTKAKDDCWACPGFPPCCSFYHTEIIRFYVKCLNFGHFRVTPHLNMNITQAASSYSSKNIHQYLLLSLLNLLNKNNHSKCLRQALTPV